MSPIHLPSENTLNASSTLRPRVTDFRNRTFGRLFWQKQNQLAPMSPPRWPPRRHHRKPGPSPDGSLAGFGERLRTTHGSDRTARVLTTDRFFHTFSGAGAVRGPNLNTFTRPAPWPRPILDTWSSIREGQNLIGTNARFFPARETLGRPVLGEGFEQPGPLYRKRGTPRGQNTQERGFLVMRREYCGVARWEGGRALAGIVEVNKEESP